MQSKVRYQREALGLSQEQLAQELGVSRQTISYIETGKFIPSLPLAIKIARFFNTSVELLFVLEVDEKSDMDSRI